jgi:hypothetical protein
MLSALSDLVDRHPSRALMVTLAIVPLAAPLGIHVHEHLKPSGFDVPDSGSAKARALVAGRPGRAAWQRCRAIRTSSASVWL